MHHIDLAIHSKDLADRLPEVLQVVRAVKVCGGALIAERQLQDSPVERLGAGVLADIEPRGAADSREGIHDFRPRAADHFDLAARSITGTTRLLRGRSRG